MTTMLYRCPVCGENHEVERFSLKDVDFVCRGVELKAAHDCNYDGEDDHCQDWLEPVEKNEQ